MKLHRSYSRWWGATIPPALVSYLLGGPSWLTGGLLAIAAGVELVAAFIRTRRGDTLSEHIWTMVRSYPALIPPAIGFAVWVVWAPLTLLPATQETSQVILGWTGGADPSVIALGVGVTLWAILHFAFGGRYG